MLISLTSFSCSYCHQTLISHAFWLLVYTDKLPLINPPPALPRYFQTQQTEVGYNVLFKRFFVTYTLHSSFTTPVWPWSSKHMCAHFTSNVGRDPQMLKATTELKRIAQLECRPSQTLHCVNHLGLLQTCSSAYAKVSSCFAASHVYWQY